MDIIIATNKSIDSDPIDSLASFSLIYPNRAPVRVHIIEKYDAFVGVLSNCYILKDKRARALRSLNLSALFALTLFVSQPIHAIDTKTILGTWLVQDVDYEFTYKFTGNKKNGEYWIFLFTDNKKLTEAGLWSYKPGELITELMGVDVNGQPLKGHPYVGKKIKSKVVFESNDFVKITHSDSSVMTLKRSKVGSAK